MLLSVMTECHPYLNLLKKKISGVPALSFQAVPSSLLGSHQVTSASVLWPLSVEQCGVASSCHCVCPLFDFLPSCLSEKSTHLQPSECPLKASGGLRSCKLLSPKDDWFFPASWLIPIQVVNVFCLSRGINHGCKLFNSVPIKRWDNTTS